MKNVSILRDKSADHYRKAWGHENVSHVDTHSDPDHVQSYRAVLGTPKIICLCGSMKFKAAFEAANHDLTVGGNIVLSVGYFGHHPGVVVDQKLHDAVKPGLDELHFRKIDLADEIFVINVGDYVGESTWNEIQYAHKTGKPIHWLEETACVPGVGRNQR